MIHKTIQIRGLSLYFPHKICFEDFSVQVPYGSKIAIIGRNGCGKSSLLKILLGKLEPSFGELFIPSDSQIGYVSQLIEEHQDLSGGQRFNELLTQELSSSPNLLILDEPTNHLDTSNKKNLIRLLRYYDGTLIVATHDKEFIRDCADILWHIDDEKVKVFSGDYDNYMQSIIQQRQYIEHKASCIDKEIKASHCSLMKEQQRASKSRAQGEKSIISHKWPTVKSATKVLRMVEASSRQQSAIRKQKEDLLEQFSQLRCPEIIRPTFNLKAKHQSDRVIVSVNGGALGYQEGRWILESIYLNINTGQRIAIQGDNGAGKSTLVRGLIQDRRLYKGGEWITPQRHEIGYLDQHYAHLDGEKTVLEITQALMLDASHAQVRNFLNDFLFRKNEEVHCKVRDLSGGEKVRLSLAQIAASTPKILILDEITNNLDLETREHVIQVLRRYPGALVLVSHDEEFLNTLGGVEYVDIRAFRRKYEA